MGLLGDSFDDPKSMATYQLVAGLLSPGSFGQGLGKGLSGYQGTLANAQDMELKKQQIASNQQEQQLRDVQIRRAQQQYETLQNLFGQGGAPGAASQAPATPQAPPGPSFMPGSGSLPPQQNAINMASANPAPSPATPPKSRLESLTQDQIAFGVATGAIPKELATLWTESKFGRALPPGYKQDLNGNVTYFGDPTKGVGMEGGKVVAMPGAADTLGALAAATKAGEVRGANQQTPIPLDRIDRGLPGGLSPTSSLDDLLNSGRTAPTAVGAVSPSQMAAVRADMQRQGGGAFSVNARTAAAIPNLGQPSTAPTAFKSPADMEAEKLAATQGVHLNTDPTIKFRTDLLEKAHSSNAEVLAKLQDTVRNEAELQNRNKQLAPMLEKIQTGGFAPEQRIALANSLQTSGLVPDILKGKVAQWVANGDPTTGKVIENQLAAAGIKTMLDTLDKEGKPNRAIFQAIQAAQESAKSGNATLKQVFALQKQLYDWHYGQEQDMATAIASPDYNPLTLQSQFSKKRNESLNSMDAAPAPTTPSATPKATMQYNPKTGKIEPVN